MSTPVVTNLPRGLLALIGARTFGKAPDQVSDQVQCVVDLGPLYKANNLKPVSDVVLGAVLNGGNAQLWPTTAGDPWITPIGKVRFPLAYGISVSCGVGEALEIMPTLHSNATSVLGGRSFPIGVSNAVPASTIRWVAADIPKDLVLLPGMGFGYQVAAVTGTVDIAGFALYAEFDNGI